MSGIAESLVDIDLEEKNVKPMGYGLVKLISKVVHETPKNTVMGVRMFPEFAPINKHFYFYCITH